MQATHHHRPGRRHLRATPVQQRRLDRRRLAVETRHESAPHVRVIRARRTL